MKLGDPGKVKWLAIVAIGAIVFVVIELLPSPASAPVQAQVPQLIAHSSGPVVATEYELTKDPFSSPLLCARLTALEKTDAPKPTSKPLGVSRLPEEGPFDPMHGTIGNLPAATGSTPKETAEKNRAIITGPVRTLTLEATMKVDVPVAMVSIDGSEAREVRAGDMAYRNVRVESVTSDGITLIVRGHTVRLNVGGTTNL